MTTFSITIPVKQGGYVAALDSIRNLSADANSYELLIAEGAAPSRQRNLAIRRSVFMELGGFDERLYPNEENELLDRIKSSGFKLVHNPAMYVHRSQRRLLKAFVRQMFAYGRGASCSLILCRQSDCFSVKSYRLELIEPEGYFRFGYQHCSADF